MGFKPHCQFEINIQGNIMVCVMKGLWNLEGVTDYFAELKSKAQLLSDNQWVRIADISEFEGGPMEIMDKLIEIQNWSVEHNCIQLLLVNPPSLNQAILDQNKDKYNGVDYCQSVEQALDLAQELLNTD